MTPVTTETEVTSNTDQLDVQLPEVKEMPPFDSIDDMRAAHTELLKIYYSVGATPEVIAQAKEFLRRGRLAGKNLDRPDERLEAQRILDQWGTVMMKAVHEEIEATLAEFEGTDLSGRPCPYVGLKPFSESDSDLFFGREDLCLHGVEILKQERFLALLGPSGSGKSSLVLGGILPRLRQDAVPSSSSWIYIPQAVPGTKPLESLLDAFRASPDGLLPADLDAQTLLAEPQRLAEAVSASAPGRSVLVMVDQFEEIFTLCEEAPVREAFASSLLVLLADSQAGHRVILTMRSDFEPRLSSLPELQKRFTENRTVLRATPMTRDELRQAIEAPAKAVGLRFHKEVIDALLKDVGDEISALPLLQFTLLKLWDTKARDRITLAQYNALSGAKGALAQSANEFYQNLLPEEQTIAKRAFLRMVRLGEGLEVTSARIRKSSLYELGYPQARVDRVVDKLVRSGLVRGTKGTKPGDDQLEVAHEALVRNWQRFVRWLEKDRASLLIRRRLDDKTLEWVRLGSGTAGLLDAVQLEEAEEWLATADAKTLGFHPSLLLLIEKSREAIKAAEDAKRAAEQQLYEQARKLEEQERQAAEISLREAERMAAVARERAEAQAKVARRMRRIAILALVENVAIFAAVYMIFVNPDVGGWMTAASGFLFLLAVLLGLVIFILTGRALFSRQQPDPAAQPFWKRSVRRMIAPLQNVKRPTVTGIQKQ